VRRVHSAKNDGVNAFAHSFFTIGHSTRSIAEFVELLRESATQLVVDVRTVRRSRTNPQFNLDVLTQRVSRSVETPGDFQSCRTSRREMSGFTPESGHAQRRY